MWYPRDAENIFRFFRTYAQVTIVTGSSPFNGPAAARLSAALARWGISARTTTAASANTARDLSAVEARTWIGLDYQPSGGIKPGAGNDPSQVGYAIQGPVILLGTPADNPLIATLARRRFLPYAPEPGLVPGPGRGYVAWQREAIGAGQESIAVIADDAIGMNEAIGSLAELLMGLRPLVPTIPPVATETTQPAPPRLIPVPKLAWSAVVSDAPLDLTVLNYKLSILTRAGERVELTASGRPIAHQLLSEAEFREALARLKKPAAVPTAITRQIPDPRRLPKFAATQKLMTAVAWWGGTLTVTGETNRIVAALRHPQDITALAWMNNQLILGDGDGRILGFDLP